VPDAWSRVLTANVPVYRRLPADLRAQLHAHMHVFLAEKVFEGCDGFEITEEVRVTIAAEACLLILNRATNYYPDLVTILVYPSIFYADVVDNDGGVVSEYVEDRSGESWDLGVVILSWEDAVDHASSGRGGYNVILHEFAHQLDMENGDMDGMPGLPNRAARESWKRVFTAAYGQFERARGSRHGTVIDPYAFGDPAEFFAVVTESFYERPLALRREYPDLYAELAGYYAVDPEQWQPGDIPRPRDGTSPPRRRRRSGA